MKIRNKLFLATFLYALLLITSYQLITSKPLFSIVIFTLSLIFFYTLHTFFIIPIEKITQQLLFFLKPNINHQESITLDKLLEILKNSNLNANTLLEEKYSQLEEEKNDLKNKLNRYIQQSLGVKENLPYLAKYDDTTSLPNRIFFNEILNKTINHAKRQNLILALLVVSTHLKDKDNLPLSDALHELAMKEVAITFSKALRSEDIIAKLEGSDFIVLLNDIKKAKFASAVAEKLIKSIKAPLLLEERHIEISLNIGISIYPFDGNSLEILVSNLEVALHQSKNMGFNTYQFFSKEMEIEAREYIQLGSDLKNAISNKELELFYQPKINIKTGKIIGVEALLRWSHPEFGMIFPNKLIPLAEETGMIQTLGEWTIREACKMNKYWQNEGYEHIVASVNLSAKQFMHPDLTQTVTRILNETTLSPNYLELEISEAIVMGNIELSAYKFDALKAIGIQLSIDHFGASYTSISCLKQFAINIIKIDPSFIRGIPHIPNDIAITNAFIALSHHLGFEVVAEGVETAEQVQYLATQQCDMVQGYFLSHPVPKEKIILQFQKLSDTAMP